MNRFRPVRFEKCALRLCRNSSRLHWRRRRWLQMGQVLSLERHRSCIGLVPELSVAEAAMRVARAPLTSAQPANCWDVILTHRRSVLSRPPEKGSVAEELSTLKDKEEPLFPS